MRRAPTNRNMRDERSGFSGEVKGVAERLARLAVAEWRSLWKVAFALVAIGDILGCWPVFREGWKAAVNNTKPGMTVRHNALFFAPNNNHNNNDNTCSNYSVYYNALGKLLYWLDWMGPLFCLLCILEAVFRALEAREEMLENAALDNFEKKLSRLYSSARNLHAHDPDENDGTTTYDEDDVLARRTLRFWTPVLVTLSVWALLLPWTTMMQNDCGKEGDSALATLWITHSLRQMEKSSAYVTDKLTEWAWRIALPFFWQPHKIYQRILMVLRWVRYFRFAGPLLRMIFKVHDQFWVFLKTQKQAWQANAEKAKRIIRRSMLFDDIRKIESLAKLPGLFRVPTGQVLKLAGRQSAEVGNRIKVKKEQGKKLEMELASLKRRIRRSSDLYPSSELYDRIRDLSSEFTHTVGSTLWSANLISPQTRFSVSWRIIVTCALMSELSRICTSFQLYGRVNVSYTAMMRSVLGCAKDRGGNILTATGRLTRNIVRKLLRMPKEQLLATCTKSTIASHSVANFLIKMSDAFEAIIDLVCFIDIYVWFFTGELDPAGAVIPKPFFYRCVLPGTLVQVLDHPTVPQVLPKYISYLLSAAYAVGYSRTIRWVVAIVPAVNIFLVDPIKKYFFRPMEHDEWLRYTESLAVFPVFSGADIRYTMSMSHPNFSEFDGVTVGRESFLTSVSEAEHSTRRSSSNEPPIPMGTPLARRGPSVVVFRQNSFLPASDMGRQVSSSSFGLNLDNQHVSWAPRVASSTGLNLDSQLTLVDDESLHIRDLLHRDQHQ